MNDYPIEISEEQSTHQQMVEEFMRGANQAVPDKPCIPPNTVRELRARLVLEEALELIHALGFELFDEDAVGLCYKDGEIILKDIIDGCIDQRVIATGTLSACGIKDNNPQLLVDKNNLDKIKNGTLREDGKLIKPIGHRPPDWEKEIERQSKLR